MHVPYRILLLEKIHIALEVPLLVYSTFLYCTLITFVDIAPNKTESSRAAESNLSYPLGVTGVFHIIALTAVGM